ncbi:MAG: hypothetical protein IKW10_08625 [Oscillospiraceae bacterium]|nr:hypothetical protein [Oscillospiraceae bacterium]
MKKLFCILICVILLMGVLPATVSAAETEIKTLNIKIKDPVASYTPGGVVGMDSNISDPMGYLPMKIATWEDTFHHKSLTNQDEFVAGLPYKVTVHLSTFVGYTFARDIYGQLAAKITINGRAVTVDKVYYVEGKITEVIVSYQYDALPGMVISSALVKNVPTPVAGNMPIYSFTLGASYYSFYPTEPVTWYDETAKRFLESDDTFIQGHRYRVQIWLAANREQGYTFKVTNGKPAVNVTLNSFAPDSVVTAYEQDPREVISVSYTFPACKAAHTHTYTDWQWNNGQHYKNCTADGCDDVFFVESHTGGIATCSQKGKCTVCGYAYLNTNNDHQWSPTYLYKDSTGHAWICANCAEHSTIEKHNPGPAATETTPQTCKDCGYVINKAKNHKHDLSKVPQVPATCTQGGNILYYFCTGCNDCFTDANGKNKIPETMSVEVGALGHVTSDHWNFDEEFHWRTCTTCKTVLAETKMHHEDVDGICASCGYVMGSGETTPEPTIPETVETLPVTVPTEPEKTTPTEPSVSTQPKDSGDSWITILLVALVCFGAGITASVIILKKKKR